MVQFDQLQWVSIAGYFLNFSFNIDVFATCIRRDLSSRRFFYCSVYKCIFWLERLEAKLDRRGQLHGQLPEGATIKTIYAVLPLGSNQMPDYRFTIIIKEEMKRFHK